MRIFDKAIIIKFDYIKLFRVILPVHYNEFRLYNSEARNNLNDELTTHGHAGSLSSYFSDRHSFEHTPVLHDKTSLWWLQTQYKRLMMGTNRKDTFNLQIELKGGLSTYN